MSLDWEKNSQLPDVQALYSENYSSRDKFPWEVRRALGEVLYKHEFNTESSAQTKSRYLDTLSKQIDELEQKDPVLVEGYTTYRELFKRKKADLYDLLAETIDTERSLAIGAHKRAVPASPSCSSSDSDSDEMSLDDEISDKFVSSSAAHSWDEAMDSLMEPKRPVVSLEETLRKLDALVSHT